MDDGTRVASAGTSHAALTALGPGAARIYIRQVEAQFSYRLTRSGEIDLRVKIRLLE